MCLFIFASLTASASEKTPTAVKPSPVMVVTANPHATEAGLEILRAGGSAVDAAIAIEAVLSLVEPQSSGLAGGGQGMGEGMGEGMGKGVQVKSKTITTRVRKNKTKWHQPFPFRLMIADEKS